MSKKIGPGNWETKKLSDLLTKTQENKHQTKWIVHSQGGLIFAEAVRYHLNGNRSWAITGGFNIIDQASRGGIKYINNFLK